MKEQKETRLRFTFGDTPYAVRVSSLRYAEALIINQLKIGKTQYWLIFQNGYWRFIGDLPLCMQMKQLLVRKIAAWHRLPQGKEAPMITGQGSLRSGILLNAVLTVMADKKQIPR